MARNGRRQPAKKAASRPTKKAAPAKKAAAKKTTPAKKATPTKATSAAPSAAPAPTPAPNTPATPTTYHPGIGKPAFLTKPADMSMEDWTRVDPVTGMSMAQHATYYKNGLELRQSFMKGTGVIDVDSSVKGAYKNDRGQWQLDMKPSTWDAYYAWRTNLQDSSGNPTFAHVGDNSWYGSDLIGGTQPKGYNNISTRVAGPQYAPDDYYVRGLAAEKAFWDDYFNAKGMGWPEPTNPSGMYGKMVDGKLVMEPPDWYTALGPGKASATGYQRETEFGWLSDNEYRNMVMRGEIEGTKDSFGQANPFMDLWGPSVGVGTPGAPLPGLSSPQPGAPGGGSPGTGSPGQPGFPSPGDGNFWGIGGNVWTPPAFQGQWGGDFGGGPAQNAPGAPGGSGMFSGGPGTGAGLNGGPGSSPSSGNGPFSATDMTNDQLSAYQLFANTLQSWGIPVGPDVASIIRSAAIDGLTPDNIELIIPDIQNTNTWKTRFPGWARRVANGYNQITVGEYLNLETSYHRILQSAGLPSGFYDDPSDFGNWISNNVSPQEIQDRVNGAMNLVRQVDPTARGLLAQFYGVTSGDIAAYFLDSKRALPTLERQYQAVSVATWAARNGLKMGSAQHYEDLVDKGVTEQMAAQGFSTVATFKNVLGNLGRIYGIDYSQSDAEADVFFNQMDKRRQIVTNEVAAFSGSSRGQLGSAQRGTSY